MNNKQQRRAEPERESQESSPQQHFLSGPLLADTHQRSHSHSHSPTVHSEDQRVSCHLNFVTTKLAYAKLHR